MVGRMFSMKFKDGKSMLKKIQSGVDLYNPETEKYVYD